jgi:hypothetical protein
MDEFPRESRTGSSISVKSNVRIRKVTDEVKRLTKMENSLKRLETRLLEFSSKMDEVLTLVSKTDHSTPNE